MDGNKNQAGRVVVDGDGFVVEACSGAIVAERTVLTTALCCDGAVKKKPLFLAICVMFFSQ